MKNGWVLKGIACFGLTLMLSGPVQAAADDVLGTWNDTEKGSVVKVYGCDGGICVQIVKVKDAGAKDVNNPDETLRSRRVEGAVIMSGASRSGDNSWKGKIYNREDGRTYSGSLTVISKDEVKLEGCGLAGLICRSRVWKRAQ